MKAIVLLKRKEGLTHEQFRHHYETVHAELAHKYLGHLFVEYRRNYPGAREADASEGAIPFLQSPYDAITELRYPNREAFEEAQRIMSDPVIGKIFADDEENFMDRASFRVFACDEVASDLKR